VSNDIAEIFSVSDNSYLEAPAGCGKTHLLIECINFHCEERQLILTHTNAGVSSIRDKYKTLKSKKRVTIETIAGFCLRFVKAYPVRSEVKIDSPNNDKDWTLIYNGMLKLLSYAFIPRIVKNSYKGVFVDEYQDCSKLQHRIIKDLQKIIPVRIVGDPLQSIFCFRKKDEENIDWEMDVTKSFVKVGELNTPWRWINHGQKEFGEWLITYVRPMLINNQALDLSITPQNVELVYCTGDPTKDSIAKQSKCLACLSDKSKKVIIIDKGVNINQSISFSKRLSGRYTLIEKHDCEEVTECAQKIDSANGINKLHVLMNHMIDICSNLIKAFPKALLNGKVPKRTKRIDVLNLYLKMQDRNLLTLLEIIENEKGINISRKEYFYDLKHSIRDWVNGHSTSITEALCKRRERLSKFGRKTPSKGIGRTHLIKGLECDVGIILNADKFEAKELYVALTRASEKLIIFTSRKDKYLNAS